MHEVQTVLSAGGAQFALKAHLVIHDVICVSFEERQNVFVRRELPETVEEIGDIVQEMNGNPMHAGPRMGVQVCHKQRKTTFPSGQHVGWENTPE